MLCKCSSGHIEFSFEIPAQFFAVNSKFFLVSVQNWWQISYPKTFFRKFFRTDTFATVLTNVPFFFQKKSKFLCSKSEQLKKKQFFKVKFPQVFPLNTCIAVLAHLDSLFAKGQKNCCRSKFLTKNIVSLVKELIFRKTFMWTRGCHLWQLWKNFWIKLFFFCLKFQENLKQCAKFQTFFFLKVFQGYVGYSFDNSGELFRQSKMKSLLRILKI